MQSESSQSLIMALPSCLLIRSELYLEILISMAKYNHKRMIAYMNNCMRKANLNEMAGKMTEMNTLINNLTGNSNRREWKRSK